MTLPITLGLDLGSGWCGVVALAGEAPVVAHTIRVTDPHDVRAAAAELERAIVESGAVVVVVEWSNYWGASKTGQEEAAKGQAREVMTRIDERVKMVCEARCVARVTIPPQTWRHRIGIRKPTPPGGEYVKGDGWRDANGDPWQAPSAWHDTAVKVALAELLGERAAMLRNEHERDAYGAALGYLRRPPEKPVKVPREKRAPKEPKPPRGPRKDAATARARAAKEAVGCFCKAKCRATCPRFLARQTAKIAPMLGRSWL